MMHSVPTRRSALRPASSLLWPLALALGLLSTAASAQPTPDPRVGLSAGLFDAGQAAWNLRVLSQTAPPEAFVGITNSDLAFKDHYAIQGNYNGVIV